MNLNKGSKKKINWTMVAIALTLIGLVSVWMILSRHANQDKAYSGAKFIQYKAGDKTGGWTDGIK